MTKTDRRYLKKSPWRTLSLAERSKAVNAYMKGETINDIVLMLNSSVLEIDEVLFTTSEKPGKKIVIDDSNAMSSARRTTRFTEENAMSSPFYGSSKFKSKQKLIKGWELYTSI